MTASPAFAAAPSARRNTAPSARFYARTGLDLDPEEGLAEEGPALLESGMLATSLAGDAPGVVAQLKAAQIGGEELPPAAIDGEGRLILQGRHLQPSQRITWAGPVTVMGDVPKQMEISSTGPMVILGDVGEGARLSAQLPERHAVERTRLSHVNDNGRGPAPVTALKHRAVGLADPSDERAGIQVEGHVAAKASLSSNAGLMLRSHDKTAQLDPGPWGRAVTLVPDRSVDLQKVPVETVDGRPLPRRMGF